MDLSEDAQARAMRGILAVEVRAHRSKPLGAALQAYLDCAKPSDLIRLFWTVKQTDTPTSNFQPWTPADIATMQAMRAEGKTAEQIGRALGRTRKAVLHRASIVNRQARFAEPKGTRHD